MKLLDLISGQGDERGIPEFPLLYFVYPRIYSQSICNLGLHHDQIIVYLFLWKLYCALSLQMVEKLIII